MKANKDEFSPPEVLDILAIDERFGTLDDLRSLIASAHAKAINFIADVPLTVSFSNEWANRISGSMISSDSKLVYYKFWINFIQYNASQKIEINTNLICNEICVWSCLLLYELYFLSYLLESKGNSSLLNVDNEQVQDKLLEAVIQFLRLGADGIHFADYGFGKKVV